MDIRRYFSAVGGSKKSGGSSQSFKEAKRRNVIIDSDEETSATAVNKRQRILDSDSDDDIFVVSPDKKVKKKESLKVDKPKAQQKTKSSKVKPSTATSFFGKTSVDEKEKPLSQKKKERIASSEDDFAKTLKQLDEQGSSQRKHSGYGHVPHSGTDPKPKPNENSPPNKKPSEHSKLGLVQGSPIKQKESHNEPPKSLSAKLKKFEMKKREHEENIPMNTNSRKEIGELQHKDKKTKLGSKEKETVSSKEDTGGVSKREKHLVKEETTKSGKQSSGKNIADSKSVKSDMSKGSALTNNDGKTTPRKESKDTSKQEKSGTVMEEKKATPQRIRREESQPDSTPSDKMKNSRASYMKYLQRSGPSNPGSKEIPEGEPDCLHGLVFVLSGVFDSLDREETAELIKKYGGKVTTSVSRNTSYLVLGTEAGESKLKKAEQIGTKQLDEDGLLDLIRTLPGKESKQPTPKQETKISSKLKSFAREKENQQKVHGGVSDASSPGTPGSSGGISKSAIPKKSPLDSPASQGSGSQSSCSSTSPKTQSLSSQELSTRSGETLMWVDKYKPASIKNIIGQQGGASNVKKLLNWLQNWQKHQLGDKRPPMPSPWTKDDTGASYKAALLSGPPGVGKTTSAHLVCKELGFDVLELNASDARSKKTLDEVVSELLSNQSLVGYATGGGQTSSKHALVMDEVDGMSGNEDRGGVQELISLIKKSKIPIIAMCNDRNHPKIRSLANHCFDLRFFKPRIEQIRGPMMSVCYREGIKIKSEALDQIIIGSNQDIRQVLHHLSVWSANQKDLQADDMKKEAQRAKKDLKKGPWDVCRAVFTQSEHKNMNIHEKSDLFFNDYSIAPLFVQENYPKVVPHCANGNRRLIMEQMAKTAASLSDGDLVERLIRSNNAWALLPTQAMFSSVLPGEYLSGHLAAQIEFPKWLGNNSRRNKFDRLMQELQMHMRLRISGTKLDVGMDYCECLRDSVTRPLVQHGAEGVDEAVLAMNSYDLLREDLEALLELSHWPGSKNPMSTVESKVKAAFTRKFNKECHLTPFAAPSIKKKKRGKGENLGDEEEEDEEEEEEEDISASSMIKVKTGGGKGQGQTVEGRGKGKGTGARERGAAAGGRGRGRGRK